MESLRDTVESFCTCVEHGSKLPRDFTQEIALNPCSALLELVSTEACDISYRLGKILFKNESLSKEVLISPDFANLLHALSARMDDTNCRAIVHEVISAPITSHESLSGEAMVALIKCASMLLNGDSAEYADSVSVFTGSVAQKYHHLLREIISNYYGESLRTPSIVVKLRYLSVLSRLTADSAAAVSLCAEVGVLSTIFDLCSDTRDPLSQMVAMDLLVDVSATDTGINIIISKGMLRYLLLLCSGSDDTPPDPMLSTHAAAVLSKILAQPSFRALQWSHGMTQEIWNLMSAVGRMLTSDAELERLAGVDTVERIATSSLQAHVLFLQNDLLIDSLFELLKQKVETQALVLHVSAKIFDFNIEFPVDPAAASTIEPLSTEIAYLERKRYLLQVVANVKKMSAIEYCVKLIKSPIAESKYGAYDLLRALAADKSGWGFQLIINHSGLVDLLLDRSIEHNKEGKEWKFSVVSALYENSKSHLLAEDFRDRLHSFLRMGPFYVPAAMSELATLEK